MRRRLTIAVVLLLALAGILAVVWQLAAWSPPGMVLRYGLTPGCEPTGRTQPIEGVEFVEIGPGCFRMGSPHLAEGGDLLGKLCAAIGLPWGDQPEWSDEMPVHWVEFRRGFWIARYELTNVQYEAFDAEHERQENSPGDRDPAVNVSWERAREYCAWLTEKSGLPIRLPSESEWECACRAGSAGEFSFGDDEKLLPNHAWFYENSGNRAHEVGARRANAWGLHDFHGNVWEWCEDAYHANYEGAPADGAAGMEGGEEWRKGSPGRVLRGGSFSAPAGNCRSAHRSGILPSNRGKYLGFRPAFTLPPDK